jgi:DNA polymerase-3 subunit gamma/tau
MVGGINIMSQVLALKYRPKRFEHLIGQSTVSQTLSLALDSNRLSHAYLLSGLRGSGKTSTARILAKSFLCDNGPTSSPCETCFNCQSANDSKHLDIIEMDAASNRGIDDIKDLIEHMKYKPSSGRFKVFIIDEIHMLTTQAFNALLKTLEEPPEFVKFILATTDPLKLPATILSRTQHFRFNKIPQKDIVAHLIHILNLETISFEQDALEILARSVQGSLRDTLTMLDQAIIFSKGNVSVSAVVSMLGLVDPKILDTIFMNILKDKELHDSIEVLNSFEPALIIDEMTLYLKDKMLKQDTMFSTLIYDRYFRILGEAKQLLYINSDGEFVLLLTLLKMQEANKLKTIDAILNEVNKIEIKDEIITPVIQPKENIIEQNDTPIIQDIQETVVEDENITKYKTVTKLIYEKNYDLGECFEKSFQFVSFENNTLLIASVADDTCRKILMKSFAHIRTICEDIYGDDIDIEFNKIKNTKPDTKPDVAKEKVPEQIKEKVIEQVVENQQEYQQETIIEEPTQIENDVSSCMESTIAIPQDMITDAQKEYQIEDIEHSEMFQNAKELFKPTKIVVTSKG